MNMINNLIQNSLFANRFFVNKGTDWQASKILKIFSFEAPRIAFVFGLVSVAINWYESLIKLFLPDIIVDALPVLFLLLAVICLKKTNLKFYKLHNWYLGFLIIAVISGILAMLRGDVGLNVLLYFVILIQFLAGLLYGQGQKNKNFLNFLLILGMPAALFGLWQTFSGQAVYATGSLEENFIRASAFFSSPNVYGMVMTLLFLVSAYLFLKNKKMIYLFGAALYLTTVAFSLSRTAWLALLIGALFIFDFKKFNLKKQSIAIFAGLKSRIEVLFNGEYWYNSSIDGRIWSLKNGLYILKQHPFLGTGPGTYGGKFAELYSSPTYFLGMQNGYVALFTTDNQFLAILVQFGILGFLAFMGFLTAVIIQIINNKSQFTKLGMGSIFSFFIMMLASNALEFTAVAIPVAFILGISLQRKEGDL